MARMGFTLTLAIWTDALSVGNAAIDAEHKEWLAILNELGDAINEGADREIIGGLIYRMESYTVTHLSHEEVFMMKVNFPYFDAHKQKHDALIRAIVDIRERWETGLKYSLTIETVQLVKRWLTNHIMVSDKKYQAYLADSASKADVAA